MSPALTAETEAYCDSCKKFTPLLAEPLSPPLETDTANAGYILGDLVCAECYSIHTVLRQKDRPK